MYGQTMESRQAGRQVVVSGWSTTALVSFAQASSQNHQPPPSQRRVAAATDYARGLRAAVQSSDQSSCHSVGSSK
uniref:Secreted protein n=1 Tax=Steinernema glaseri TaxID=37863 RepID=A0A1I8A459_9BILA